MTVSVHIDRVEEDAIEADEDFFPWIGELDGLVVLFCGGHSGTVLASGGECEDFPVGHYANDWDIELFDCFDGAVTLANDDIELACDD